MSISEDENAWLQRGLGILCLFVFLIQLLSLLCASPGNADGQHFETFSTCKHATAAFSAGICSGVLGGLFSIAGPPTMILTLSYDIPKDEWRATNSLYMFLQLPVRMAAIVFFNPPRLNFPMLWIQVSISLAGGLAGLLIGNKLAPLVSQAAFRRALLLLLLLGGTSLAAAGTPIAMYCLLAASAGGLLLEMLLVLHRWRQRRAAARAADLAGPDAKHALDECRKSKGDSSDALVDTTSEHAVIV